MSEVKAGADRSRHRKERWLVGVGEWAVSCERQQLILGKYQATRNIHNESDSRTANSVGKESTCNAGDPGSIPGSGRSAGEGIGYPLQYSVLENSMDGIVHGVAESDMTD